MELRRVRRRLRGGGVETCVEVELRRVRRRWSTETCERG